MTWVIVAGALGVITITGGLFLRRLLGELAALRSQTAETGRQITGIDRQMRAQRAQVRALRQHLADGEDDDGTPPARAAVANGDSGGFLAGPAPEHHPPDSVVRKKRHLGLIIGGTAAALAAISEAARHSLRALRGHLIATAAGAAFTAATLTIVTVQPWTDDASQGPPSSAPAVLPTVSMPPYYTPPPATTRGPSRSRAPSASPGEPDGSAGTTPGLSPSPSPTVIPVGEGTFPPGAGGSPPGSTSQPGGSSSGPGSPGGGSTTTGQPPGQSLVPPLSPPGLPPPTPQQSGPCLAVALNPLLDADVCLPGG